MKRLLPLAALIFLNTGAFAAGFDDLAIGASDIGAAAEDLRPTAADPEPAEELPSWDDYFARLEPEMSPGGLSAASLNRLDLLVDGDEVMAAAVADIRNAVKFIHIEVFHWQPDETGFRMRDLLAERVRGGVQVRVILDQYGSALMPWSGKAKELVRSMREAGIDVRIRGFEPLHLDHRKVMVMDDGAGGLTAYTGGMNIGDDYQRGWHDQQTRVAGPAITSLHRSFLNAWSELTGEKLSDFPEPQEAAGGKYTRVIAHTGGNADRNIKKAYLLAIGAARKSIRIENPYFTDKDVINALIAAASDQRRPGLKVQLIVPARTDMPVTLRGFRSHYPAMLKAGVEVYEYQPRMAHLKVAVMDGLWSTVGSSNLDDMSLKHNDEMNLLVLDEAFAAELESRIFEKDIAQSLRVTDYNFNIIDSISGQLPFRTAEAGTAP